MTSIDWPGVVLAAGASLVLLAEGFIYGKVAERRRHRRCRRDDHLAVLLAQVERRAVQR